MISPTLEHFLTQSQQEQFHESGYCVVADLFTSEQIEAIQEFFEQYKLQGGRVYDGGHTYEEIDPTKQQLRAMHPHRYSKKVLEWFLNENVMSVLELLLGSPALGVQTMYYYKPPGAKGQGMHQDNFYLLSKPATCIAAWTAIDESTDENGCLWVVPGSHRYDIFCPKKDEFGKIWNNYGDSHINPFPREAKPIPVPVPRGATMFFGGNLIHGSGPNRTQKRSRRTFIGHYIDEASESVARFYHPIYNQQGEVVSHVQETTGGGPCGEGWLGAVH